MAIVLGCLLVAVTVAYSADSLVGRTYAATARVYVGVAAPVAAPGQLPTVSAFSRDQLTAFSALAVGSTVTAPARASGKLDMTDSELARSIEITSPTETTLVDVTVSSGSARESARAANAVAEQLAAVIADPGSSIKAQVVEPADVPSNPVAPFTRRNVGLAAVIGLVIGAGWCLRGSLMREIDTSWTRHRRNAST
ncbi:YveK family protein [Williamsia serinedens]|uniref:YveK family protein n=1 Tax=Williamsia serinedens TaxID=391736 RepID=UPI0020A3FB53|nr:hypothetical protein [Williamsia serinedens]